MVENGTSSKECILKHFVNPNHPVCAAAVASHLFLMAQPPLLYQEGNCRPDIHSQLHGRAYNRFRRLQHLFKGLSRGRFKTHKEARVGAVIEGVNERGAPLPS